MTSTPKIGFAGLGQLGTALVQKLDAACRLRAVWNRTGKDIGLESVETMSSFEELCQSIDWLFSCVADDAALKALADRMTRSQIRPTIHVSFATCSPDQVSALSDLHHKMGVAFVNAPVLGRPDVVEAGQASFLLAGDTKSIDLIKPILESVGNAAHNLGTEPGLAAAAKLAINYLVACQIASLTEAAHAMSNFDGGEAALQRIIKNSPLDSPIIQLFSSAIDDRAFTPALFDLELAQKDLNYFQSMAPVGNGLYLTKAVQTHMANTLLATNHSMDWSGLASHLLEPASEIS